MATFKPLLSASLDDVDLSKLNYPYLASPKLDGLRCIIGGNGVAYSRNMKPFRNKFLQKELNDITFQFDGELIVGSPTEGLVLGRTQSGIQSAEGEPDFKLYVFDRADEANYNVAFIDRLGTVKAYQTENPHPRIVYLKHKLIHSHAELLEYERECLTAGYEGVMLRDPTGPYKQGRSTLREGYLMKLKRFIDGEAVVESLEEAFENTNEATIDELGRTKRSTHQENKVPKGMIGVILARDKETGGLMRLGPGVMTHKERVHYWNNIHSIIGYTVHWRAFGYGQKDTPRFPRFYGFREDE